TRRTRALYPAKVPTTAPSPPSTAPTASDPPAPAVMAPPDIAPDQSRATKGPGLVRAGVLGSLSPTSSPSASAENTQAVTGSPRNESSGPSSRSRPSRAAQATKAGAVIVRRPATAP